MIWRSAGRLVAKIRRQPPKDEPIARDPFLELALRSIVPGWLHHGNVELFDYCLANLPSAAPVIEIGSFAGLSLNTIIYLLKRHGRSNPVFSVDEWTWRNPNRADVFRADTVSMEEHRHLVMETFRRNVSLYSRSNLPHHIVANSDRFFAEWAACNSTTDFFSREVALGGPISFAYIDGDHSYEQSLKDFQNISKHLEVGGFVVFDDSWDESPWQCARTAREAAERSDYRLVDKRPNFCLQKIA